MDHNIFAELHVTLRHGHTPYSYTATILCSRRIKILYHFSAADDISAYDYALRRYCAERKEINNGYKTIKVELDSDQILLNTDDVETLSKITDYLPE